VVVMRASLRERVEDSAEEVALSGPGRLALATLGLSAVAMIGAPIFALPLGRVTISAAALSLGIVSVAAPRTLVDVTRRIAWSIVPLVAALFVVVAALDQAGLSRIFPTALAALRHLPGPLSGEALAAAVALACALANNLTIALLTGHTWSSGYVSTLEAHRALVALDLGPNLAVSGSLATLLWLRALRREGIVVTPLQFACIGACVLTPALAGAALLVH
jgi:arsenical pump membrane protein